MPVMRLQDVKAIVTKYLENNPQCVKVAAGEL